MDDVTMTIYVLDAGAIISGVMPGDSLTSSLVKEEVLSRDAQWNLESLLSKGLSIKDPEDEYIAKVDSDAKRSGDDSRISRADVSILALSLERKATLVTDDYSIQNVAKRLGITFLPVQQKGITAEWEWYWLCRKCKAKMDGPGECLICGGEAYKRSRKK